MERRNESFSSLDPKPKVAAAKLPMNKPTLAFIGMLVVAILFINIKPYTPSYDLEELKAVQIPQVDAQQIVQALEVESAYRMTNVKFATFNRFNAKMAKTESFYLEQLFDLVNIGVVERVQWFAILREGVDYSRVAENHTQILREMNALRPPERLEKVHYLILNAVNEEYD